MSKNLYGLIARFETPASVMHAAEKVRDSGYTRWDVITPFPIHGMDAAMGLKRSRVPRFTLAGGITGFTLGMLMIWWMGAVDYPLIVGGKPYFSPIFAFPISYELTILLSAFGTIAGMFILNRLPIHYHPVLKADMAARATDDGFFIVIEKDDPKFSVEKSRSLLEEAGAVEIGELED
ncbi:MAG: DUF3341 domain-containing protein [Verrucomicrobia bacterium]|nr:MAG: DUF3341 domain-containing protein [Verrucomicrobiota bacterium]